MAATTLVFSAACKAARGFLVLERLKALLELCTVFFLIQCALWSSGTTRAFFAAIALLAVLPDFYRQWPGRENWLLLWDWKSWEGRTLLWITLWVCLAAVLVACWMGTLHQDVHIFSLLPIVLSKTGYILSAFLQFSVARFFFFPRLVVISCELRAVFYTAMLFSLAHMPNLELMSLVLIWFVVALSLSLKLQSIVVPSLMQAALSITLLLVVPPTTLCFHVGARKFVCKHTRYTHPSAAEKAWLRENTVVI